MSIPTPKHFRECGSSFQAFIVQCAINDRIAYIDAMRHSDDEEDKRYRKEAMEELKCMRKHLANIVRRRRT